MNLAISIPLLLSMSSAYFLLLDEDINQSTRFISKRKDKATALFPKMRDHESVQHRLQELGKNKVQDLNHFRFTQIAIVMGSTFGAYVFLSLSGKSLFLSTLIAFFVGISGYVMADRALTKKIAKNRTLLESEFPAIVEMLTLCMAAGETPLGAMSRVSQRSSGLLSAEFSLVIQSVTSGIPFQFALDEMHARNAREAERNRVLSAAGKSEVSMMIPVVFLILPISILFALWPSLSNLNLFLA